jgi:hypothetical protein
MVASTSPDPSSATEESPQPPHDDPHHAQQHEEEFGRAGVRHLFAAASKVASLQYRIILTRLKLTMMRVAISTGLYIGAAVFGILAVIFLFVALFHLLLRWLPPEAAYAIFGGGLAILAVGMVLVATKMIGAKDDDDDDREDAK